MFQTHEYRTNGQKSSSDNHIEKNDNKQKAMASMTCGDADEQILLNISTTVIS